jgi:hypothetical protein
MNQRLSEQLWGIDWASELPLELTTDGVRVEFTSYDGTREFIERNYAEIFEEDAMTAFSSGEVTNAKVRYYTLVGDFFAFKQDNEIVGLLVGTAVDWSTYYIRSSAMKKAYQGRALIQRFLPWVFARLERAGVERIEADAAPSNMTSVYWLTRQRFNVTGTLFSERWGALTRFTKFLSERREATFLEQFCTGVQYQKKERARARRALTEAA